MRLRLLLVGPNLGRLRDSKRLRRDYDVTVAEDPERARHLLERDGADVVITYDAYHVLSEDPYDFLKRLRAERPQIGRILVATMNTPAVREAAKTGLAQRVVFSVNGRVDMTDVARALSRVAGVGADPNAIPATRRRNTVGRVTWIV